MKKWMLAVLFACVMALPNTAFAQQVTPDSVGYIVKVGD